MGPAWEPTLTLVDSGGGVEASLYTWYHGIATRYKYSRMSWSSDGSALMVANSGPLVSVPTTESSLWAVSQPTANVSKKLTWSTSDELVAVICHTGTADCDLVRASGRIVRRRSNGDTVPVLRTFGFFTSANGRFILHSPTAVTQPFADATAMELLDVESGINRQTNVPDLSPTFLVARRAAVSDDGAEVAEVGHDGFTITRHRIADGSSTAWTIAKPDGWTQGQVLDLQWAGSTLQALVRWTDPTRARFVQYAAGSDAGIELGTTLRGPRDGDPSFAWRPEVQRLLVQSISACEIVPEFDSYSCAQTQYEIELMRGGVTTRVARSRVAFMQMAMSPDGRWLGYGLTRVMIKSLPE